MCDQRNRPLCATVARHDGRLWWLMNRSDKGFCENGVPYARLADIPARWAVLFGDVGEDAHGRFVHVALAPRRAPTSDEIAAVDRQRAALAAGDWFEREVAGASVAALCELAAMYQGGRR